MREIIGIDLGTTNSAVAIVQDGVPRILAKGDDRIIPSVVGLTDQGELLVGTPAWNQYVYAPQRTVRSIKRKMGTGERVTLGDRSYTPQEISAMILRELAHIAETHLGHPVREAVITVPAYFNDAQRQATRDAGIIAGLDVVRIINEPTAASLAYGMNADLDQVALVYDLGGGTFDASLIEMRGGIFEVRASHGDTQLGGDDFDVLLAQTLKESFEQTHQVSVQDPRALARLNRAAEGAKIALSNHPYVLARQEYLMEKQGVPLHLEQELSRQELEMLVDDLLQRTLTAVDQTLRDAKLEASDLDVVLLVGGSTFIPRVHELLGNHLGIEPRSVVNPREVVALGAAVQGAIIAGQPVDAILVDVTPHSLGIEIATIQMGRIIPGIYKVLIPRNTAVPTSQEEEFYTLYPDQDTVRIQVYQGERPVAEQNTLLGEFLVKDLKPIKSEHQAKVDVQFSLDIDGVLHVEATDRRTGKKKGITVTASPTRMDASEIARAQAELQLWDEEAGPLLARARLLLHEDLDEEDHKELERAISDLEKALQSGDRDTLEEGKDELLYVLYELEE